MGQSLDLIIPESLRSRHWEGYRNVMAEGRSQYESDLLAVPALKKDGNSLTLLSCLGLSLDAMGRCFRLDEHPRLDVICNSRMLDEAACGASLEFGAS